MKNKKKTFFIRRKDGSTYSGNLPPLTGNALKIHKIASMHNKLHHLMMQLYILCFFKENNFQQTQLSIAECEDRQCLLRDRLCPHLCLLYGLVALRCANVIKIPT